MTIKILIVDDQVDSFLQDVNHALAEQSFTCFGLNSFDLNQVLDFVSRHPDLTLMLLDIMDGDGKEAGIDLFDALENNGEWKKKNGSVQIVVFSQKATAQRHARLAGLRSHVLAGYLDKSDFLATEPHALNLLREAHLKAWNYRRWPTLADEVRRDCDLVYSPNSKAMESLWERILLAGRSMENVLIQGETGTGKELVAKAIFQVMKAYFGTHKDIGPLISYNIASAPTEGNLLQVELFGAEPNSYSGAPKTFTPGLFERASKERSPIFLDEIGDAPQSIQVALLRVLQDKEVTPLGAFGTERSVRIIEQMRLIAASNVFLDQAVREKRFRADLFYRLRGILLKVPPLRERKDDIPVLTYHFLNKLNEKYKEYGPKCSDCYPKTIPPEKEHKLLEELRVYDWPGNVRELEMAINASYALSPGTEFVLSEDVKEILRGVDEVAPKMPAELILESLRENPRPPSQLKKDVGEKNTIAAIQLLVNTLEHHPTDDECEKYFGPGYTNAAFRKWASDNGIPSPRRVVVRKPKTSTRTTRC